jgi:hypothetical protein
MNTKVEKFIRDHGRPVGVDFPANALSLPKARELVFLLREEGMNLVGMEPWHSFATGYEVDGAKSWYVDDLAASRVWEDAIEYLDSKWLSDNDLIVVEYD